jgi:hypothetical protein
MSEEAMKKRIDSVWVTIDGVMSPKIKWEYSISPDDPNTPEVVLPPGREVIKVRHCISFDDLCVHLRSLGHHIPPVEYFEPDTEERENSAESIFRRIPPEEK